MPRRSKKLTEMQRATLELRSTMDRVLDRSLTAGIRKSFHAELKKIERDMAEKYRPKDKLEVSARDLAHIQQVVRLRLGRFGAGVARQLADTAKETRDESVSALARALHALRPQGTSLDDHASRQQATRKGYRDVDAARKSSGKVLITGMDLALRKNLRTEASEGITYKDIRQATAAAVDHQWWRVERLIRTENSIMFNRAQYQAFLSMDDEERRGIFMRWTEHVTDIGGDGESGAIVIGSPMDDRVGKDSLVLHGQIAEAGGSFIMPPHLFAPSAMVGKSWLHPPNRPNDRAILTPWESGAGIGAWKWQNGRAVYVA